MNGQAYVSFYYADEDYDKYIKFKQFCKLRLPKSKYFDIYFSSERSKIPIIITDNLTGKTTINNNYWKNKECLDIIFKTRYNRNKYLKKIYQNLGISLNQPIKIDKKR